jgi:formylglycine-generating enzyme required for sulfatase activity
LLRTGNALIQIEPEAFWEVGEAPPWADDWGWDDYGAWVELTVAGADGKRVRQRMRWIESGSFLMGSPEGEPERFGDEGPQHRVTIEEGFWLFDTACTQALWQAVMGGDNPSSFTGADRPVEQVSWHAAQGFVRALNERIAGLDLALPSEAQWEYACRAGTTTPFSFGDVITREQVNYGGSTTVPVKSLPPNAWGLYEMHGNVWEWVQDVWHKDYQGAPADGTAWEAEAGASRVIRGGSWSDYARHCRCACRGGYQPGYRNGFLGFRCARVQGREPGRPQDGAERANLARPGPRSGSGRVAPGSSRAAGSTVRPGADERIDDGERGARLLRLDVAPNATTPLLRTTAFRIVSDHERLTVRQIKKPDWASAIGRDGFGLWADIAIEPSEGDPVIQRLRWIPPGRFVMGSPEGEPRRYGDEGPRREVCIDRGFWFFDTPCTQALWEALLGDNPSQFPSAQRPVEQVSWDDVQERFLPALNERIPGFALPSEAQWEHACRAGTETALYAGPIEIVGDANAPALDPIAWYGGNSSVGFELENGVERSWLTDMQYPSGRAGTHPVKGKEPNAWGLYDMLGNVWECVHDAWHENYEGAPGDSSVWEAASGADRVIRGGSWSDFARICRCAVRSRCRPDDRNGDLGFRCARAHGS